MDIVDIIKNTKKIYMSEASLQTMMDIERVLDSLDIYAFKNWKKGELVEGPVLKKHWVESTFMWPKKSMPDPDGAKRLLGYNGVVTYEQAKLKNNSMKNMRTLDFISTAEKCLKKLSRR